jgi:NAD(P)-dependent dehydrogenase (short-subunit alcohol dehydrogenase family)
MTVCGEAARRMAETGGGSIINIGTLATTALQPKGAEYSSTKAAMVAASKVLAREGGRDNVRVHVVTPGYTTGEPLDRLFEQMAAGMKITPEEMSRRLAKSAVLERHVDPEDIAEACLFLASDRSRNITGIELHVTAGQWI